MAAHTRSGLVVRPGHGRASAMRLRCTAVRCTALRCMRCCCAGRRRSASAETEPRPNQPWRTPTLAVRYKISGNRHGDSHMSTVTVTQAVAVRTYDTATSGNRASGRSGVRARRAPASVANLPSAGSRSEPALGGRMRALGASTVGRPSARPSALAPVSSADRRLLRTRRGLACACSPDRSAQRGGSGRASCAASRSGPPAG